MNFRNIMQKRGQVTLFVIIGILLVIVVGIIFYLYGDKLKVETEEEVKFDSSSVESVKTFIQDCVNKYSLEAVNLVGKQGGEINPGFYQNWNCRRANECDKVSYLCYTTEYNSCYNKKPFLHDFVEKEIHNYLKTRLKSCIDLDKIESSGFNVNAGELKFNVSIGDYATIINLNYPITISKGDSSLKLEKFSKSLDVPLGRLIEVASDIVNQEINNPQGVVNYENYGIKTNGEIQIERHTYSNTKIYTAKTRNNPYKFNFAVQNYVTPFP